MAVVARHDELTGDSLDKHHWWEVMGSRREGLFQNPVASPDHANDAKAQSSCHQPDQLGLVARSDSHPSHDILERSLNAQRDGLLSRYMFPNSTCGKLVSPRGDSKLRKLVARLHQIKDPQGGPREIAAPGQSRRVYRMALMKPILISTFSDFTHKHIDVQIIQLIGLSS